MEDNKVKHTLICPKARDQYKQQWGGHNARIIHGTVGVTFFFKELIVNMASILLPV